MSEGELRKRIPLPEGNDGWVRGKGKGQGRDWKGKREDGNPCPLTSFSLPFHSCSHSTHVLLGKKREPSPFPSGHIPPISLGKKKKLVGAREEDSTPGRELQGR